MVMGSVRYIPMHRVGEDNGVGNGGGGGVGMEMEAAESRREVE